MALLAQKAGARRTLTHARAHGAPGRISGYLEGEDARQRLLRLATRYLPAAEAEDAAHDGIVQALAAADKFRLEAQVSTWLHQIVVNSCLMQLRRGQRAGRYAAAWARDSDQVPGLEPTRAAPPPDSALEERRVAHRVRAAVESLPSTYREVIERCVLEEGEVSEVATELGLTEAALRTRLRRGKRQLAALLAEA